MPGDSVRLTDDVRPAIYRPTMAEERELAKIETQKVASNGHALTEKNSDEIENYVGVPLAPSCSTT